MSAPTIAVVTPWKDNLSLAPDFFAAIDAGKPDQLIVVDDCSEEPLPFAALRLDTPGGFSTASNAGLALVETEYVLFLNNDVSMTRADWLDEIRESVRPGIVLGPLRFEPHGAVDGVAYPYTDGWCAAMLTEDARRIGGWDERYDAAGPGYFSDNALSFEARRHGMSLVELVPGLDHKGGQTGGKDRALFERALAANGVLFAEQVRAAVGA